MCTTALQAPSANIKLLHKLVVIINKSVIFSHAVYNMAITLKGRDIPKLL